MRFSLITGTFVLVAFLAPAAAQTPPPHHPLPRKTPIMSITNPGGKGQPTANGSFCNRNSVAAQQRINPITGQPQAQTIVSIPVTNQTSSIAASTNHQQQLEACAHAH
jgi:hypothetical protein